MKLLVVKPDDFVEDPDHLLAKQIIVDIGSTGSEYMLHNHCSNLHIVEHYPTATTDGHVCSNRF